MSALNTRSLGCFSMRKGGKSLLSNSYFFLSQTRDRAIGIPFVICRLLVQELQQFLMLGAFLTRN